MCENENLEKLFSIVLDLSCTQKEGAVLGNYAFYSKLQSVFLKLFYIAESVYKSS